MVGVHVRDDVVERTARRAGRAVDGLADLPALRPGLELLAHLPPALRGRQKGDHGSRRGPGQERDENGSTRHVAIVGHHDISFVNAMRWRSYSYRSSSGSLKAPRIAATSIGPTEAPTADTVRSDDFTFRNADPVRPMSWKRPPMSFVTRSTSSAERFTWASDLA